MSHSDFSEGSCVHCHGSGIYKNRLCDCVRKAFYFKALEAYLSAKRSVDIERQAFVRAKRREKVLGLYGIPEIELTVDFTNIAKRTLGEEDWLLWSGVTFLGLSPRRYPTKKSPAHTYKRLAQIQCLLGQAFYQVGLLQITLEKPKAATAYAGGA